MKASITIDPYRVIGQVDPNIYGQFMCRRRWVADVSLYAPDHPDADERGLRKTVAQYIKDSAPPVLRWPGGCTLVAIRRGRAVLVPEGNTVLQEGDIVTGFGAPGARRQVIDRLHEEPEVDIEDAGASTE